MKIPYAALALCVTVVAAGEVRAQTTQPRLQADPATCQEAQVYFEYGSDDLNSAAEDTAVALVFRLTGGPTLFEIVGHVDAAEAADAGLTDLSDARAKAVAARLAPLVPGASYRVEGIGGSEQARRTRPGVAEALNRRVSIVACPA